MSGLQWARLQDDMPYELRRGAWYRVASLTPHEAMLEVNRRSVRVPRDSLTFVSTLPQAWTIVPRPPRAKGLPATWGDRYAVCPSCRNRARMQGAPQSMRCGRCERVFRVGWDEWSVGQREVSGKR